MPGYSRRHHLYMPFNWRNTPREIAEELTLKLSREDLFDRTVLLPHAELNEAVYTAVEQFVTRYDGSSLRINILGCSVSESIQDTFREVYRAHFDDEYEKVARYLRRRYNRIIALMIVGVVAFYAGIFLFKGMESTSRIQEIITEAGIFCMWEVGYTHFDRAEAVEELKRIIRSRDAEIQFD